VTADFSITKDCKHPEKAMAMINWLFSIEGSRVMYSGVEGQHWDYADGMPTLKDETIQLKIAGGNPWQDTGIRIDENIIGLSPFTIDPANGKPVSLFETEEAYVQILTPVQKDFCAYYNITYPAQIFEQKLKEGKNKNRSDMDTVSFIPTPPDDISRIEAKVLDIMMKQTSQCILAASDEEFAQRRDEAVRLMKEAGSDELYEWFVTEWTNARAVSAKLN